MTDTSYTQQELLNSGQIFNIPPWRFIMLIETRNASYQFIRELGLLVDAKLTDSLNHLLPEKIDEEAVIAHLEKDISNEEIEQQFASLLHVSLNITDDCNFRCQYCVFSGNYEHVRTHRNKKMSFETAQKLVNHLISWISKPVRTAKVNHIIISFYGGEPLTESNLIKKIIDITRKQFGEADINELFNVGFRLNTNGLLLDDKNVDFLVRNNITIDISLDGPAQEHDKFRVDRNGGKTWSKIWENISRMKSRYPEYYKSKVHYLATLHPQHNFEEIDRFFLNDPDFFPPDHIKANQVNLSSLRTEAKSRWFAGRKPQVSIISQTSTIDKLLDKLWLRPLSSIGSFTAMCFPGAAKLFISSDGTFHTCERFRVQRPLGHVDTGIDFDAVRDIYRSWQKEIIRNRCWECSAWPFCEVCAAICQKDITLDCTYKNQATKILKDLLEFKESEYEKKQSAQTIGENDTLGYIRLISGDE